MEDEVAVAAQHAQPAAVAAARAIVLPLPKAASPRLALLKHQRSCPNFLTVTALHALVTKTFLRLAGTVADMPECGVRVLMPRAS